MFHLSLFFSKNNDVYNCNNYRCSSLTSCFGKLFTLLLQSRLHNHIENNNFRQDLDQVIEQQIIFILLRQ